MEVKNIFLIFSALLLLTKTCNGRFVVSVIEYEFGNIETATVKCGGTIISNRNVLTTAACVNVTSPDLSIGVQYLAFNGTATVPIRHRATVRIHPDFASNREYNVAVLEIEGSFGDGFESLSLGALNDSQSCFLYGWGGGNGPADPRRESVTVNGPDSCPGDNTQAYCSRFGFFEALARCPGLLPGSPLVCGDERVVNGMVLNGGCSAAQPYLYYHSIEDFSSWILWETAGAEMTTKVSGFLLFAALLTCLKNIL
ncbi:CLUMA_CG007648, isoform A [Clunio marinus]|uniref:CLUMA_CG007648, isoform A n=1 Tax=Clunio marinus TaxID=568069 RepID=A0A1J1I1G6_9DIPT|nr:CLUMA_CG007648, isoform A [Clunio marinus]